MTIIRKERWREGFEGVGGGVAGMAHVQKER
jgi:hypothetical protein